MPYSHPSLGLDLVPERGSPLAPPPTTVYWTLNGLLTSALCCQPKVGTMAWLNSTSLFRSPTFMTTTHL